MVVPFCLSGSLSLFELVYVLCSLIWRMKFSLSPTSLSLAHSLTVGSVYIFSSLDLAELTELFTCARLKAGLQNIRYDATEGVSRRLEDKIKI